MRRHVGPDRAGERLESRAHQIQAVVVVVVCAIDRGPLPTVAIVASIVVVVASPEETRGPLSSPVRALPVHRDHHALADSSHAQPLGHKQQQLQADQADAGGAQAHGREHRQDAQREERDAHTHVAGAQAVQGQLGQVHRLHGRLRPQLLVAARRRRLATIRSSRSSESHVDTRRNRERREAVWRTRSNELGRATCFRRQRKRRRRRRRKRRKRGRGRRRRGCGLHIHFSSRRLKRIGRRERHQSDELRHTKPPAIFGQILEDGPLHNHRRQSGQC